MRRFLLPVLAVSLLAGCTIQERMPVREVAYDFSDYNYYDRPYAESPEYRTSHSGPETQVQPAEANIAAQQTSAQPTVITSVAKTGADKAIGIGTNAAETPAGSATGQGSVSLCASPAK